MAPPAAAAAATLLFLLISSAAAAATPCFTSLFSFSDRHRKLPPPRPTGKPPPLLLLLLRPNLLRPPLRPMLRRPPHRRLHRSEGLGLPLLTPFPGKVKNDNFPMGANLAEGGATALDFKFLAERGINNTHTNQSLHVEIDRFKQLLTTLCSSQWRSQGESTPGPGPGSPGPE
ncbi:GDSL esterase/lipase At1g28580 [Linum perenne]